MKTRNMVALAVAAVLSAAPGMARADGNFYLAGSVGSASLEDTFDEFDVDTNSTAIRFVGGWQFNRYFSAEFGYHNFGTFEQRFDVVGMPLRIGLRADGFTLGLTGTLPIGEKFGLFGRVGSFFWDGDTEINNISQGRPEDTNLYLGLGAKYRFTEHLSLVGDWTNYELEDTRSDVLSIGLSYDF